MRESGPSYILAVDDNPQNLSLLRLVLSSEGYQVALAESAADLDLQLEVQLPDLILLDVILPDVDGYQVCARLKADPQTRQIPVLMLSSLTDRADKLRGLEVGAADFISKPFDRAELLARVRTHLRLKQLYDERTLLERDRNRAQLVERLLLAHEEERRRVAYDLHDGLAQIATAAQQHLECYAARHHPRSAAGQERLDQALELARLTVSEARRLIANLRPTALDDYGLARALRGEVEALRAEGWEVEYEETPDGDRLPGHVETALFRVAQEALTNARKHAGTRRARVALSRQLDSVQLQVRDWGRGFEPPALAAPTGPGQRVGLAGMEERIALLEGRLTIRSRPGAGTHIIAEVPLKSGV